MTTEESAEHPGKREETFGALAGLIYLVATALAGVFYVVGNDTTENIAGVILGVLLVGFGSVWLAYFLRRTFRSYKAGRDVQ